MISCTNLCAHKNVTINNTFATILFTPIGLNFIPVYTIVRVRISLNAAFLGSLLVAPPDGD